MSEEEETSTMAADEEARAVFVDTNLHTHLAVPVFSTSSVTSLKRRIRSEHLECFPEFGRISIKAVSVKCNDSYYRLPDYMLLQTAFHGVANVWSVFADVWTLDGSLECPSAIEFKHIKPHPQHHNETKLLESSPHPHSAVLGLSGKRKNKRNKNKVNDMRENLETKRDIEENLETKSAVKEQLDEETRHLTVPRTENASVTKHQDEPRECHHDTPAVHPSVIGLKDGGDKAVKHSEERAELVHQLEADYTNLAQRSKTIDNECGIDKFGASPEPQAERNKKRKESNIYGANQNPAATSVQGPDIPDKVEAASDNKNTIYKEGLKTADDVSALPSNFEKGIREDDSLLKSDHNAKKRKTKRRGRESKTAETVSPLHLNNVSLELLLPQEEPLNVDKEKEIKEDVASVKSGNTANKRKIKKSKRSNKENKELSGKRRIDDQKADDAWDYIHRELPDDTSRPDGCVETMSETPKRSENRKVVPGEDPHSPKSTVKEQPDEEIKESIAPITVIQSDKPKKRGKKKQSAPAVDPSSLSVKECLDETMEMDAPKIVDAILSKFNTDALLNYTSKIQKTAESEQDCRSAAENVSQPHLNNVSELFSEDEALNFVEKDRVIKEDVAPLESERATKKRKIKKSKSSGTENHDLSGKMQNGDLIADNSRHIHGERSLSGDVDKPEESVESMSESLKKTSQNRKAFSRKDTPGSSLKDQSDAEMKEKAVPKTVFPSDKSMIGFQKKQPVPGKGLSSLSGNQQLDEKMMETVSPKSVEEAVDLLTIDVDVKNEKEAIQGEGHQNDLTETASPEVSVLSDLRQLGKSRTRKHQAKNVDQLSVVDTSSNRHNNSVEWKKNRASTKTSEQEYDISTDRKAGDSRLSVDGSRISGKKFVMQSDAPRRVEQADDLFTDAESNDAQDQKDVRQGEEHHVEYSQASKRKAKKFDQPSSIELQKFIIDQKHDKSIPPPSANHSTIAKEVMINPVTAADPADTMKKTDVSHDAQDQKDAGQVEEHHVEFSHAPPLVVCTVIADARRPENSRASKQKAKKLDQPSSIDTSSTGHTMLGSKKNRGNAKTSKLQKFMIDQKHDKSMPPPSGNHSTIANEVMINPVTAADPTNTMRKTYVSRSNVNVGCKSSEELSKSFGSTVRKIHKGEKAKKPPNKLKENPIGLLSAKETKIGLLSSSRTIFEDGTSSSSDDEYGSDALTSSAILPPDNLSSSDYSEGESEAVLISQPGNTDSSNGIGRSKANSSGSKLESILRSSSRYKKARLVASQSQEESPPPEFVPDSLAEM